MVQMSVGRASDDLSDQDRDRAMDRERAARAFQVDMDGDGDGDSSPMDGQRQMAQSLLQVPAQPTQVHCKLTVMVSSLFHRTLS